MYFLKPKEGFVVPITYIKKESLDISDLKDSIYPVNSNDDINNIDKKRNKDIKEEKNDRLVFDIELNPESNLDAGDEKRKIQKIEAKNIGKLVLDEEELIGESSLKEELEKNTDNKDK